MAQIAAGFGSSVGTAHAYTTTVIVLLALSLLKVLREHDPEYVLLDGTLAECDRVGDGWAGYSHKHRHHGVDVQVVADRTGRVVDLAGPSRTVPRPDCGSHLPDHPHVRPPRRPRPADRAYQGGLDCDMGRYVCGHFPTATYSLTFSDGSKGCPGCGYCLHTSPSTRGMSCWSTAPPFP